MTTNLLQHFLEQPMDYRLIISEFNKPNYNNRFLINLEYLLKNSEDIQFSKDVWIMRPEFFCADEYGHPFVYPIILLVNNLKSIFEFLPEKLVKNNIIKPKINNIIKILQT